MLGAMKGILGLEKRRGSGLNIQQEPGSGIQEKGANMRNGTFGTFMKL
jgi:hypothetical protein